MSLTKVSYSLITGTAINVLDYGATGDGITDDLAAFNLAKAAAVAGNKSLYIPATASCYRLSNSFELNSESLTVFGDGVTSLILIDNVSGASAIIVRKTMCSIRDIGITGVVGSGNGLEINMNEGQPVTGQGRFNNIWVGWVDGDCFKVTRGQTNTFTSCYAFQNNGYEPRAGVYAAVGKLRGNSNNAFHVASEVGNNTNDQTFVNCMSNAGALGTSSANSFSLKVGTQGASTFPQSVKWFGGLMQGSALGYEFYLSGTDHLIDGCHIEASSVSPVVYIGQFVNSTNSSLENCLCNGDVLFTNSANSGFQNVVGWGFEANNSSNSFLFWHDGTYGNVQTGPTTGLIVDPYGVVDAKNLYFASGGFPLSPGVNNITEPSRTPFVSTQFDVFSGGLPLGFTSSGGTVTQVAAFGLRSSGNVVGINNATFNTKTLKLQLPNDLGNKKIYVEAFVYNQDQAGSLYLFISYPTERGIQSFNIGMWEKVSGTFVPPAANTSSFLYFTTTNNNQAYINNLFVSIENDSETLELDLLTAANDAAAAALGVKIGQSYLNGSVVMTRIA